MSRARYRWHAHLVGAVALVSWLVIAPFWWWSQQRAPRKASFANVSLWEEDFPHLTADGKFAASAKKSKSKSGPLMYDSIVLREIPTGKIYWQFNTEPFKYFDKLSPDGKFLVVLTPYSKSRPYSEAHVFDIAERREVGKCKLEPFSVGLTVSPGGTTLAEVHSNDEEKHVILYDVNSGERKVLSHSGFNLLFSPDGSRLAVWDMNGISIIDLRTEKVLPSFALPSSLDRMVFSPDGQTIFAIHEDGTLRAWDIRTRSDRVLLRRSEYTNFIRVSGDGKALAVGYLIPVEGKSSELGETIVLDTETGQQVASFQKCHDATFGSDGKTLVTAHEDLRHLLIYLNFWDLPPRGRFHWGWIVFLAVLATGWTIVWWYEPRKQGRKIRGGAAKAK